MTDKEKLLKLRKLADDMYYAAQHLTTDASRLHRAIEEYHQFIINEYHKEEPVSEEWIKELRTKLDSLSKEDFEKVWAKYSRYGEEGSVDYNKLNTMLNDALSKETKESWNKRLSEEHVSEGLEEEIDKYIKDNFTIDKEQLDRLGIEEKDYMYSMDRGDILAMVRHFANLQKQRMMKDTVVMEAHEEYGELWGDITKCSTEKGKKYKVIILKM